jgi:ATP/maltotriose-dependent transcriptional regulator MalT
MAEPLAAAPPERDVLLATKLHVPASRPDLVPRPRLAERLDEGLTRGLILVCAPAGYGKTILLADWSRGHPAAWLSLDATDNDPARFWLHAIAALDRTRPGIAKRVAPLLGPPAPSSVQLHRNAAAWYAGCGLADDAIGHAAAAGEMLWAARIIEQHFDRV